MKLRNILTGAFMLSSLLVGSLTARTQDTKKDKDAEKIAQVKNLVDSQNYVFVAQSAMPMSGRVRQLTPDFDLKVTKSSIVSYLPYFGRAYTAPIDPTQ